MSHNFHLNQQPKTEFLASFTREFRNKGHSHEGKFYLTWNAHSLRFKVFKKIAAKKKERSRTTDLYTFRKSSKNRHEFTFISFRYSKGMFY